MSEWPVVALMLAMFIAGFLIGNLHGYNEACVMYRKHVKELERIWNTHLENMKAIWRGS